MQWTRQTGNSNTEATIAAGTREDEALTPWDCRYICLCFNRPNANFMVREGAEDGETLPMQT